MSDKHELALRYEVLMQAIVEEAERQDVIHPDGYPATRDGIFLGISTAIYELRVEALEAWHGARCKCSTPRCDHADWTLTEGELKQAAAVILRTLARIALSTHRDPAKLESEPTRALKAASETGFLGL